MNENKKKTPGVGKKMALALGAAVILPMAVELGLRGAGVGESTRLFTQTVSNGERVWVDSPFFTRPFFGPGLSRESAPLRIPVDKPEDELRIVVLGGSAAMGDPMSEFGLSRHLEAVLRPAFPDRSLRVINLAMTAINSHVVRRIARESLHLEPDIMVIYMGNNEVVGPFGPGTIFSGFFSSTQWIRLAIWARSLRLGQGLATISTGRAKRISSLDEWGGMEMFLEGRIDEDDPRLITMRSHFRTNLGDILDLCRRHQILPVVSTVAVNLDAFPPFLPSQSPPDDFVQGRQKQNEGDREVAWSHFQRACDRDQLRFRADSRLNDLLRNLAGEEAHRDVVWVDADEHFRQRYLDGHSGDAWFVDHVHFSFMGNLELARVMAERILASLPNRDDLRVERTEAEYRVDVGFSPWAERLFHNMMGERYLQPPFNQQVGQAERLAGWAAAKRDLEKAVARASITEWSAALDRALVRTPADAELWMWKAGLAHQAGQIQQARDDYAQVMQLLPHRSEPIAHWASVLVDVNGPASAGEALMALPVSSRVKAKALRSAGLLAERKGEKDTALVFYSLWHDLDPGSLDAMARMGHLLTLTGDPGQGREYLLRVKARAPSDRRVLAYLGTSYQALGQTNEAITTFIRAADHAMGDPVLLGFVSHQLRNLGDEDHALMYAQRAWTLNPGDAAAGFQVMDHARKTGDIAQALQVLNVLDAMVFDPRRYHPFRAILLAMNHDISEAIATLNAIAHPTQLERTLQAWLAVTSDEGRQAGIDPDLLNRVLATHIGPDPEWGLIPPAILADRGRFDEAGQHLQLLQILPGSKRADLQDVAHQINTAIQHKSGVSIPADRRANDPVLAKIWQRIGENMK